MKDEPLLPDVADGDEGSFRAVVERYAGLVWSLARRRSADASEAEDAVQEIFTDLWRSAGRYDPGRAREVTFVAMIARRRLIDRQRRSKRERRGLEQMGSGAPASGSAAASIESVPDANRVVEAIEALGDEQRRVLGLSLLQGWSHGDIAKATSLPLGTVKSHLRRGLERIRAALAGERR